MAVHFIGRKNLDQEHGSGSFLKRGCGGVHVKVPLFVEIFKICQEMGRL